MAMERGCVSRLPHLCNASTSGFETRPYGDDTYISGDNDTETGVAAGFKSARLPDAANFL